MTRWNVGLWRKENGMVVSENQLTSPNKTRALSMTCGSLMQSLEQDEKTARQTRIAWVSRACGMDFSFRDKLS